MSTASQGRAPIGAKDHLAKLADPGRFWSKVARADALDCWEWTAATNAGYGVFYLGKFDGRAVLMAAHRWAYLTMRDEGIGSLVLDHLCRNRACVNPWHLEPVTNQVNAERGLWGMREVCPSGHPYDEANTARRSTRRGRECIRCRTLAKRASKAGRNRILQLDPSAAEHGRLATYTDWMCRCQRCKDAYTAYRREWRIRRAGAA